MSTTEPMNDKWADFFGNASPDVGDSQGLPAPLRLKWDADADQETDDELGAYDETDPHSRHLHGWALCWMGTGPFMPTWFKVAEVMKWEAEQDKAAEDYLKKRAEWIEAHGITSRELRARLPFIDAA